ncbi:Choline/ethanolaminephosphotransferase [Exidia glandulosa HHB12029]|uniref:Choline/ethanolaminephosphotransferase n=1 Tax=Exidia glandulosa HHB12029 TaxID=1314781 RepID=A0A165EP16_EXIGL|nr:Choline/ethanolaminephosphotransferase [Exidia glandulosa HHB12029]
MFDEPLLSSSSLQNLKYYKYSSIDKSPVTKYVLRHWWDFAASLFPAWIAPNLITLLGLSFIIGNVVCQAIYDPELRGTAPSWVYFTHALGLFLYQTFDNVDGRQARRTRSSSALGHAFDHTIDSLNCVLGGLLQCASVGLGNTRRSAILALTACWAMWSSTWEEYHTHTLYLGYVNGPTEGLLLAVAVHLVSGIWGPQIWHTMIQLNQDGTLAHILGVHEVDAVDLFLAVVLVADICIHTPACFLNVKALYQSDKSRFTNACLQNLYFAAYSGLILAWLFAPHSAILSGGHFLEYTLLMTFTFGKLGPRVILSYLTRAPFPGYDDGAYAPLIAGACIVHILPLFGIERLNLEFIELVCLHCGLIFSTAEFLWWWTSLCRGFCQRLDIWCLTLKPKPADKSS